MSQTTTADSGTSQAQEKMQEAAGQAREKAQEGAERARRGLRGQVDQRSTQAGKQVRTQSEDIRTVAQQLREQGKEGPAKLADQAAERAERVGGWLEESDADRIMSEVEDFARRNAWAVAVGGLALGFAASRMLKASSSERYHGSSGGDGVHGRYGRTSPAGLPRPYTAPPETGGTGVPTGTGVPAGTGVTGGTGTIDPDQGRYERP
jgi:hypothetical protein